ncbi:TetR family transcriptional regulator [Spirillospora sp. NPDC047279]|uniref:TetR family transcriptional regulator n=1 Tax=Spirillospora sp. NPDC047279 TaxID=3155478 RepID=UPI0033D5671E
MSATAPEAHPAGPETQPQGRRERKKQRTREALIDAAFDLFAEKGFDATTVEEIADAVDVSSRTFFRYFASKEDVALTFQEEQFQALLNALTARPPDEPVITAMRRAVVGIMEAAERGELGFATERFDCMMTLMQDSTTLLAGSLEHAQKKQATLTRVVADRMGVDPAGDLRPHVVAATANCAFRAAADMIQEYREACGDVSLAEAADQAFAIIEGGLNFPSAPRPE